MSKVIVAILTLLILNESLGQELETNPNQFSIGVGIGYGTLQHRYNDGNHKYQFWDDEFRPFIFNVRYSWQKNLQVAPFINAQYTYYRRVIGDEVYTPPMFFLTTGVGYYPASTQGIKLSFFGGMAIFDRTFGYVFGPGVSYRLFTWLEAEAQLTYARTYGSGFVDYQMADGRLLLIFIF